MFRTIKSYNDFVQLQQDINLLAEWANKWQLKFNVSKCNWLHLGRQHGFGEYTIGDIAITSCNVVRDLGIQVDSLLKFHDHTSTITKKANRLLSIIHKVFQHFDKTTFINLYKTYIRPVLEYGNIIWGPLFNSDQQQVEKVQRRLMHDLRDYAYNNRLEELNLPSLNYWRRRGDMIMIYITTSMWNQQTCSLLIVFPQQGVIISNCTSHKQHPELGLLSLL